MHFLFCGSNAPGTWTVRTTGFYQVLPAVNLPISVAESPFQVRRTATRTALASSHVRGNRYRLVATVTDQRKHGFKPTDSAEVVFQRKVDGAWKRIRGSSDRRRPRASPRPSSGSPPARRSAR